MPEGSGFVADTGIIWGKEGILRGSWVVDGVWGTAGLSWSFPRWRPILASCWIWLGERPSCWNLAWLRFVDPLLQSACCFMKIEGWQSWLNFFHTVLGIWVFTMNFRFQFYVIAAFGFFGVQPYFNLDRRMIPKKLSKPNSTLTNKVGLTTLWVRTHHPPTTTNF